MEERSYTVVLHPQEEGGYTVLVPALPEAITEGETREEALAMAREVIEMIVEDYVDNGRPLPEDVIVETVTVKLPAKIAA